MPPLPKYTLFHNLDLRLDPTCAGWLTGKLTDISQNKGYFGFADGRPVDLLALFLIIDAMPPAALATQGRTTWVPTIELSVNVRNLPRTGRLKSASGPASSPAGSLRQTARYGMKKETLRQSPAR